MTRIRISRRIRLAQARERRAEIYDPETYPPVRYPVTHAPRPPVLPAHPVTRG